MANVAIFPEKRTRSQLTLPDEILQIPPGSPMKDARSALRNHNVTLEACSSSMPKQPSDDTDDELLLSPGKKAPFIPATSNSKRSASPSSQDEYTPPSGTLEGRLLKRAKRELGPSEGTEGDAQNLKASKSLPETLTPANTRDRFDPTVPATARRSARNRSATKNKKQISTLSASPPPTTFSPIINSPKIGRAQSVPLFPVGTDTPHIDLRNPPRSPTRSRSRSRSPSKGKETKLRTLLTSFPFSKTLPTIHDEIPTPMDMDEASSSFKEIEMETPAPDVSIEPQVTPTVIEPTSFTPPTPPSTSTVNLPEIPATPVSRSLNILIPMSPLTPLPETPLPPRPMPNVENRYTGNLGWGLSPTEGIAEPSRPPLFPPTVESSTLKSRLPRPATSMAPPPAPSFRMSRSGVMGPPPVASSKAGPSSRPNMATTSKKVPVAAPKKDAFAMLMKKPRDEKERLDKEKAKQRVIKPMVPPSSFASMSRAKEPLASGSMPSKMKMKDKMRPKMKPKQEKAPLPAPFSDEEEEEEEAISESEHPFVFDLVPVILPEDRPLTPTRVGRSRSLPDDASMEIVEDSEGEGQAKEPESTGTVIIADTEQISKQDAEIQSAPIVEAPMKLPFQTTMSDAGHIVNVDVDIISGTGVEAPGAELHSLIPETETTKVFEPAEGTSISAVAQVDSDKRPNDEGHTDIRPPSRAKSSKLPLGKKRQPTAVVPGSRVTRSISNSKRNDNGVDALTSTVPRAKPETTSTIPTKRTISKVLKKPVEAEETSKANSSDVVQEKTILPPGSPMKLSSPDKALKPSTPPKTPGRFIFSTKPASSPSPTKIARSSSLFSIKSSSFIAARTFSMAPSQVAMGAGSSLSTLSNALEKLRMPAPSRPNTSMGFNRDAPGSDDGELTRTKDDTSIGMGRPEGLKRASTLGTDTFNTPAVNAVASSSKAGSSTGKNLVQKPLSMFMSSKGAAAKGSSNFLRGTGRTSMMRNKPIFNVGGGPRRTISKKTTLPMVVGSPVKGGGSSQMVQEEDEDEHVDEVRTQVREEIGDVFRTSHTRSESALLLEDLSTTTTTESTEKVKGKEKDFSNVSRRVSMVSHALSQSLNAVPPPPARGLMGPPATPPHAGRSPKRSASSSYPSTSAGGSSPLQPGTATGTRASARIAKSAPFLAKVRTDASGKKSTPEAAPAPNPAVEAIKVLRDCVIFVDVKTDTGEEAGSLFVELLEGVGARVLTRVGQTCTHIVYKNGLLSTLNRYRLLRDPKPLVVGIAWVVECVEQRKRVDEAEFLVDLEGANIAGINKRRRSMLPKSFSHDFDAPSSEGDKDEDGDRSMDGSTSSVTADDDLAPLERARRRKSIMVGLRP